MKVILIIVTAIAVYSLGSFYIGLRGYQYLGAYIPFVSRKIYWLLFWLFSLSLIIGRFPLPEFSKKIFINIGAWWMALAFYAILLLPVIDIGRLAANAAGIRGLLSSNIKLYIGTGLACVLLGLMLYGAYQAQHINIKEYDIKIAKKAGGLNNLHIVLISDLHLGQIITRSRLDCIVEKVNSLKPDIVLVAGDIIDDDLKPYKRQNMAEAFRKLNAEYGVFGIPGNHDGYGTDPDQVADEFEKGNINMLRDRWRLVAGSFYVIGRDYRHGSYGKQNSKLLSDIMNGIDKRYPIILLNHEPTGLAESQEQGVDLQLSGHTHGGQLFPANLITKRVFEQDWGYLRKGSFQLIVTSGAATWGPPIRIGTKSEIVSIRVKFE